MAKFNINDADNYGGQGGSGYFSLKNNHDIARVRFMYDSIDDVDGYAVHEISDESGQKFKKISVNCLRGYGDPVDVCPFCKSGKYAVKVKYFVPLYNIDQGMIQVWERGKKFGAKLSSLCARYPHLISHTFEIERVGEAGDQQTTYEIFETGQDESTLADFDTPNDPLGTVLLDKSAEDMQYFLDRGRWMDDDNNGGGNGIVRRSTSGGNNDGVVRRTPAGNGGSRRGEAF